MAMIGGGREFVAAVDVSPGTLLVAEEPIITWKLTDACDSSAKEEVEKKKKTTPEDGRLSGVCVFVVVGKRERATG